MKERRNLQEVVHETSSHICWDSSFKMTLEPEFGLIPCLSNLCLLKASWHEAKYSCLRASSALILNLGLTVKHLSTRSNSDLGIISKNPDLRVFCLHQSCSFKDGKDFISSKSCFKIINQSKRLKQEVIL